MSFVLKNHVILNKSAEIVRRTLATTDIKDLGYAIFEKGPTDGSINHNDLYMSVTKNFMDVLKLTTENALVKSNLSMLLLETGEMHPVQLITIEYYDGVVMPFYISNEFIYGIKPFFSRKKGTSAEVLVPISRTADFILNSVSVYDAYTQLQAKTVEGDPNGLDVVTALVNGINHLKESYFEPLEVKLKQDAPLLHSSILDCHIFDDKVKHDEVNNMYRDFIEKHFGQENSRIRYYSKVDCPDEIGYGGLGLKNSSFMPITFVNDGQTESMLCRYMKEGNKKSMTVITDRDKRNSVAGYVQDYLIIDGDTRIYLIEVPEGYSYNGTSKLVNDSDNTIYIDLAAWYPYHDKVSSKIELSSDTPLTVSEFIGDVEANVKTISNESTLTFREHFFIKGFESAEVGLVANESFTDTLSYYGIRSSSYLYNLLMPVAKLPFKLAKDVLKTAKTYITFGAELEQQGTLALQQELLSGRVSSLFEKFRYWATLSALTLGVAFILGNTFIGLLSFLLLKSTVKKHRMKAIEGLEYKVDTAIDTINNSLENAKQESRYEDQNRLIQERNMFVFAKKKLIDMKKEVYGKGSYRDEDEKEGV